MLCGYTHAHCVTGRDRYLVLVLSKSCAIIVFGIQFVLIQCHPEWIGIGVGKYFTEYYFLRIHVSYHVLLVCHIIVCLDSSLMAVNLCAAHKKNDSRAAHKVILACFLQSCSTRRWISCSAQNRARVLYMKDNSRVTREFGPSNTTKIQEYTLAATHEC